MSDFVVRNVDTELYQRFRARLVGRGEKLGTWLWRMMVHELSEDELKPTAAEE
jgi:hypothetical protein